MKNQSKRRKNYNHNNSKFIKKTTMTNNIWSSRTKKDKQDKYTMDPGQSSLSQQKEKTFWSTKTNKKNA